MTDYYGLEAKIDSMIDDLQGLCSQNGLSNTAAEEEVVTSVFLYKFLNDRFMSNIKSFAHDCDETVSQVIENKETELDAFYDAYPGDVVIRKEDTIEYLSNDASSSNFAKEFDNALKRISDYEENDKFKVQTADGTKQPLFEPITTKVEESKRNAFAKAIFGIITTDRFDFPNEAGESFDYYSAIFEHLIKNYNVASGTYAEYFTPQSVSEIIAEILVNMAPVDDDKLYEVYDPAAGSGSLVLHLANKLGKGKFGNRAHVYTQDISRKSTRFLRINMMLNGLTESLDNIVQGDTLLSPSHYNTAHETSSGYKKFDYITVNPPFKMDFSSTRNQIEGDWEKTNRFFAGIPNISAKSKNKMAIYLCFIQHVLWSLKDTGKAAIVCPTGFLTAKSKIESTIRRKLIDSNWLQGVISMPSNIFANTGTNVSVIFIDKAKKDDHVILIDASKLGEKRKENGNQRTVLRPGEIKKIENAFINQTEIDDFSVIVTPKQIKEKNYSFSAGQYFPVKIEYVDITADEFARKMSEHQKNLDELFAKDNELQDEIKSMFSQVEYEN